MRKNSLFTQNHFEEGKKWGREGFNVLKGFNLQKLSRPNQRSISLSCSVSLIFKSALSHFLVSCLCLFAHVSDVEEIPSFRKKEEKMIYHLPPWVNFINVITPSFYASRSYKRKKLLNLTVFFALLGSACVKAARKMIVKLTPCLQQCPTMEEWERRILVRLHLTCSEMNTNVSSDEPKG